MKLLNQSKKEVPVLHFQGKSRHTYREFLEFFMQQKIDLDKEISIITFCDEKNLSIAPLIKQLEINGINYENPALDVTEWKDTLKLSLVGKVIDKIMTPYVLVLDSLDVVLTEEVSSLVERYKSYNKKILFGATKNNFPDMLIDKVDNRDWLGEFKYLNAGTCIGERNAIKEFYKACASLVEKIDDPTHNEQLVIRAVFDKNQDKVGFDYKSECFQTFSRCEIKQLDDKNVMVV